jgi:hypothetical protein
VASDSIIQQLIEDAITCEEIAKGYSDNPQLAEIAEELAADKRRAVELHPPIVDFEKLLKSG